MGHFIIQNRADVFKENDRYLAVASKLAKN